MESIKTLQEAIIHFADYENCYKMMVELRWPDGKVKCPHCDSEKVTYLAKKPRMEVLRRPRAANILIEDRNRF